MDDCLFCKIIKDVIPSRKVYEDDNVLAFLDINPKSNGHILVIPKRHFENVFEITDQDLININSVVKILSKSIINKMGASGFNYINNYGSVQEVKHYHVHIVPNYDNVKVMSLEEIHNVLRSDK